MGKQIKELTVRGTVEGTDMLPMQGANDLNYYGTVAQIGGYAVKATCDTAEATQQKVVTLTGYTGAAIPSVIAVVFDHANEYGDCTASPATFPQLVIQNDTDTPATLAILDVCDSRGHTAGTGCWNDGDRMEFAVEMTTSNTGRAIIKNSDVRQATSTMTIKSDGSFEQPLQKTSVTITTSGNGNANTFISNAIFEKFYCESHTEYVFINYAGSWVHVATENDLSSVPNATVTIEVWYRKIPTILQ